MLSVEDYDQIRRLYFREEMSRRAIAEKLGHSRKTVDKAIENPVPPGYRQSKPRAKPVIDPVKPIIEAWIDEDRDRPRKQRHSAQRIFERLVSEHGFEGSAVSVRRYVRELKQAHDEATKKVYAVLAFEPGEEAQVDWGQGEIELNHEREQVQLFCMRMAFSRASFVRAYRSQNMESFLDGHVRAFEFFGGIPDRLAYDNLKTAVNRVGKGRERDLNPKFAEMKSWYLFDARFCNVASGNEKGHVENLVKRAQSNFMTPLPIVESLDDLNEQLAAACLAELDRQTADGRSARELWDEEQARLNSLPELPFPACRTQSARANKQSLVSIDGNHYSVPIRFASTRLDIRAYVDRIEIIAEGGIIATHARSEGKGECVLCYTHFVPMLNEKPGLIDQALAFKNDPWGDAFAELRRKLEQRFEFDGTLQFIRILQLHPKHSIAELQSAATACLEHGAVSEEALLQQLRQAKIPAPSIQLDLSGRPDLQANESLTPDLDKYNALLSSDVSKCFDESEVAA